MRGLPASFLRRRFRIAGSFGFFVQPGHGLTLILGDDEKRRKPQAVEDPLHVSAEACKDQAGACLFCSLAAAHQEPQSRRVNVGHAGKIEDELPSTGIGKVLYLLAQKRSVAARQEFPRQTHDRHIVLEADGNSHNPVLTGRAKSRAQPRTSHSLFRVRRPGRRPDAAQHTRGTQPKSELTCYEVEESLSSADKSPTVLRRAAPHKRLRAATSANLSKVRDDSLRTGPQPSSVLSLLEW